MRRVIGTTEDVAGDRSAPPSRRLTLIACAGRLETVLGRFAAGPLFHTDRHPGRAWKPIGQLAVYEG